MQEKTLLIGLDIPKYLKSICDEFLHLGVTPDMTERERKAYKAGVDVVLSLLDQACNEMLVENDNELLVHVSNILIAEEFFTTDEIIKKMNEV